VRFTFRPMSERDADAITTWWYEGPYAFYDSPPNARQSLLNPAYHYYAVTSDGDLMGFCCFGEDARVPGGAYPAGPLDVGLGMRPDLTGRGLGLAFFEAILAFGRERFHPAVFRLTVAAFNKRAIRVYERAGFRRTRSFTTRIGGRAYEFLQMERQVAS
jgi:ribosomal-protein-alanine N-acetyltransferase